MSASMSLLASLPAVQQLQAGCLHLDLPPHAAVELVRFLTLKRLISLRSPTSKSLGVSPGYQLDRLWHWMLLNTQVARGIHALVGGEVDHATPDAAPLGDDTKMLRRLLALNLMAREGWAPDTQLWKEPGTVMADIIQESWSGDSALLYVSRATTNEQQQLLRAELKAATPDPTAAAGAGAVAGAPVTGRKRAVKEEPQAQAAPGACKQARPAAVAGHFHLVVCAQVEPYEVHIVTEPTTPFLKLLNQYAAAIDMKPEQVRLILDGTRIDPNRCPAQMGLADGDVIGAIVEQSGC